VQLKPEALEEACKAAGYPATIRMQEGYDHSYYFISTFVDDHIAHHAAALKLDVLGGGVLGGGVLGGGAGD
jgi:S-formylglutathione hydrolase